MILGGAHSVFRGRRAATGTSDAWVIHYTLAGRVVMRHAQGDLLVGPGQMLVIEPRQPVSWEVATPAGDAPEPEPLWEVIYFIYQAPKEELPLLRHPCIRPGYSLTTVRLPEHRERIVAAMHRALDLHRSSVYSRSGLAECALKEALVWHGTDQKMAEKPLPPLILEALRVIDQTLAQAITAAAIARQCSVSRSKLMSAFSKEIGQPLMAFREQRRMQRARQLLQGGHVSVKQVALEMGYGEPKYFSRRFRRCTGVRPSVCRPGARQS